jgi:hypothetical protein
MNLHVEFSSYLPDKQISNKLKKIAKLLEEGYTEGRQMPAETNWKIYLPHCKEQLIIAGSKINE